MLTAAVSALRSWDAVFHPGEMGSLPETTGRELRQILDRKSCRALSNSLRLRCATWSEFDKRLSFLMNERQPQVRDQDWNELESLATAWTSGECSDPVAASIAAVFAMAACQTLLDVESTGSPSVIPDLLDAGVKTLIDAGAYWAPMELTKSGIEGFQAVSGYADTSLMQHVVRLRGYRKELHRKYVFALGELAGAFRQLATAPAGRAHLAGLLWTLGDVPRSHLLVDSGYVPTMATIRNAVAKAVLSVPRDPCVQAAFLGPSLREGGLLDLAKHPLFHARMGVPPKDRNEQVLSMVYESALITHMAGGPNRFRDSLIQVRAGLVEQARGNATTLPGRAPATFVKLEALLTLIDARLGRIPNWTRVAQTSTRLVTNLQKTGMVDAIDASFDIPFYYLNAQTHDRISAAEALEDHRCAGQLHSLTVVRPRASPGHGQEEIFGAESDLLQELRGAHFFTLQPRLPIAYKHGGAFTEKEPANEPALIQPTLWSPTQLEVQLARRRIYESLNSIHEQMRSVDPAYAAERSSPCIGVGAFADLIAGRLAAVGEIPRFGKLEPASIVSIHDRPIRAE